MKPLDEIIPEFEAILDYLKHKRGCDLTGYKRSTLMRRFRHRMRLIKVDTFQNYFHYLQRHPEEYLQLLDDILINFTSFFRDHDAWDALTTEAIAQIIASKQPDEPIRLWSAGCAGGQEIYSLLILMAEALGLEACLRRVQCFATDVDEAAIQLARRGIYRDREVANIPPDLLQKYFQQTEQGYVFHPSLRRKVVFGHHDLAKDAPMSKIDLLTCRNVLIYFNPETQASILVRFHFALKHTGFLFLGKSETLTNRRQIFTPVNLKQRIYAKGLDLDLKDHLSITPRVGDKATSQSSFKKVKLSTEQSFFWKTVFEASPIAQFAVDSTGDLVGATEQATLLFALTPDDWNRPFRELEPGKILASQDLLNPFYHDRNPVTLHNVQWSTAETSACFEVTIVPIFSSEKQLLGTTVTFVDTTECKQLTQKLRNADAELTSAP